MQEPVVQCTPAEAGIRPSLPTVTPVLSASPTGDTSPGLLLHLLLCSPSSLSPLFSLPTARWHQQGMCVHRESSGEQLHGPNVGQVLWLVRGFHQEGAASEGPQDAGEPAGRAFHEAVSQGAGGAPEALQIHHSDQAVPEGPPDAPWLGGSGGGSAPHPTPKPPWPHSHSQENCLRGIFLHEKRKKLYFCTLCFKKDNGTRTLGGEGIRI